MRHAEAAARLRALPSPLPPGPEVLFPIVLEGPGRGEDEIEPPDVRRASVLILVVPDGAGEARIVLIERGRYDGVHSGEIALPGGAAEARDADVVATALRETAEEIGPDAIAGIEVVGTLDPIYISVSNFRVTPVIALGSRIPDFEPDPGEVAGVVVAPLDAFLTSAPIRVVERWIEPWLVRYGAYDLDELPGDLAVWGGTARILGQLGAVLAVD